jgi:hypothetical protein
MKKDLNEYLQAKDRKIWDKGTQYKLEVPRSLANSNIYSVDLYIISIFAPLSGLAFYPS